MTTQKQGEEMPAECPKEFKDAFYVLYGLNPPYPSPGWEDEAIADWANDGPAGQMWRAAYALGHKSPASATQMPEDKKPMSRERCRNCTREQAVGFSVPDALWFAAVDPLFENSVLCINCFDIQATERGVRWAHVVQFWPVDGVSMLDESLAHSPASATQYPDDADSSSTRLHSPASATQEKRECGGCGRPPTCFGLAVFGCDSCCKHDGEFHCEPITSLAHSPASATAQGRFLLHEDGAWTEKGYEYHECGSYLGCKNGCVEVMLVPRAAPLPTDATAQEGTGVNPEHYNPAVGWVPCPVGTGDDSWCRMYRHRNAPLPVERPQGATVRGMALEQVAKCADWLLHDLGYKAPEQLGQPGFVYERLRPLREALATLDAASPLPEGTPGPNDCTHDAHGRCSLTSFAPLPEDADAHETITLHREISPVWTSTGEPVAEWEECDRGDCYHHPGAYEHRTATISGHKALDGGEKGKK